MYLNFCRSCFAKLPIKPLAIYRNGAIPAQSFTKKPFFGISEDLRIYQCEMCGLIQHNSSPVSYYKNVIRTVAFSPEMRKFRLKQFSGWIKKNNLYSKKLIEIGSGKGEYLELFNSLGVGHTYGLENSKKNINQKINSNLNIIQGHIESVSKSKLGVFDAFCCFSYMEHWPNLKKSFQNLKRLLKKDAIGIIEVPNFDMIQEKSIYTEFTIDHIFYFTKDTLKSLLELYGFNVLSIKSIWYDYILSAEVKVRQQVDFSAFDKNFVQINDQINSLISKYNKNEVVVWGAGHQSLSVISMSNIIKKINCIVDSALFKQNKFIYGTKLKVRDPAIIKIIKPKLILVIAAGFSNEVVKIIKSRFPEIQNIYVLEEDKIVQKK